MHPQILRDGPGSCPICGMALEPLTPSAEEPENPELIAMTRRFWAGVALSLPLLLLVMADDLLDAPVSRLLSPAVFLWLQFALATPVVLWGGWPFFLRGWQSLVNRSLNMFTLIALGTGIAYAYSVWPCCCPASSRPPSAGCTGAAPYFGRIGDRPGPAGQVLSCAPLERAAPSAPCWTWRRDSPPHEDDAGRRPRSR